MDTELDKSKLVQSKKPGERKAVKKAYEEAILHRFILSQHKFNSTELSWV